MVKAVAGKGLADLKKLRDAAAAAERERARLARQAALAEEKAKAKSQVDHQLFVKAVGQVEALPKRHRGAKRVLALPPALPVPRQRMADDARVMQESLSDEFDVSTLLETDAHLSFKRPGLGADVLKKLRRGDWSIQAQLDLHGLRQDEARTALAQFVRESQKRGVRCVRVVHGKGLGSPGKSPVLKNKVHSWLVQKAQVLAFVQAKPSEGGAGALVVLLAGSR